VEFSQGSWLESDDGRGDGLCYGKVARVDDLDRAAASGCDFGLEFAGSEDVGAVSFELAEGGVDGCGGEV
jgi:hypothetical protein